VTATERAVALARAAGEGAWEKKAEHVVAIDVSAQLALADVFVLASATNERQVGAIVDEVAERVRRAGGTTLRREGGREDRWVLLDFGDLVVHVQHREERAFYQLERLWRDCPTIDLGLPEIAEAAAGGSPGMPDPADAADAAGSDR